MCIRSYGKRIRVVGLVAAAALSFMIGGPGGVGAQTTPIPRAMPDARTLDQRLRDLKEETLFLNRDLSSLQDDLLYPGDATLGVYLAVQTSESFFLDSVAVLLDGRIIAGDLYGPAQIAALRRGGIRRLYLGTISSGRHLLEARLTGVRSGATIRQSAAFAFEKGKMSRTVLATITDGGGKSEPTWVIEAQD